MTAVDSAKLSERRMVAAGLRAGIELLDQDEQALAGAAVELIVRACGGEYADLGWPWVREADASEPLDTFWLDAAAMTAWDSGRPEHPVMSFVEALAGGRPVRQLGRLLARLAASERRLVLSAFHHATNGRRDVARYAFGGEPWQLVHEGQYGDPWRLVDDVSAELRFWPTCVLDRYDRPAVTMRPRLKVAGGAR